MGGAGTGGGIIAKPQYLCKHSPHELVMLAYDVIKSGKYNSDPDGLHIVVNTQWNVPLLDRLLVDYEDKIILQYLLYGWPANRDLKAKDPIRSKINHKGAIDYEHAIKDYLRKEKERGRLAGPFEQLPFSSVTTRIGVSPLNTVEKRDSQDRRIIVDFSWPHGNSVNDGIDKDSYLHESFTLTYPTVDTLAKRIFELGVGCALFKKDLTSAFRQLMGDMFDYSLMIYSWDDEYWVDLAVAMGMVSAPGCCQRLTNAITHIHVSKGFWLMNYLDDFIGAEKWSKVFSSYEQFGQLLRDVGAQEAPSKASPPDTLINCLGTLFDTLSMEISVLPDRILELQELLNQWRFKVTCTRNELEKLIGKIQFVTNCVKQGRVFIARMLNTLRKFPKNGYQDVPSQLRKDVKWWYKYLPTFNGTCILWHLELPLYDTVLATDSSLHGGGGVLFQENLYFRIRYPASILNLVRYNITHLEMLSLLVALKLWGPYLTGKKFVVGCDNQACVHLINRGKAVDTILQQCLRELVYVAARFDFWIRAEYISTHHNVLPDQLSRWPFNRVARKAFRTNLATQRMTRQFAHLNLLKFDHDW